MGLFKPPGRELGQLFFSREKNPRQGKVGAVEVVRARIIHVARASTVGLAINSAFWGGGEVQHVGPSGRKVLILQCEEEPRLFGKVVYSSLVCNSEKLEILSRVLKK